MVVALKTKKYEKNPLLQVPMKSSSENKAFDHFLLWIFPHCKIEHIVRNIRIKVEYCKNRNIIIVKKEIRKIA